MLTPKEAAENRANYLESEYQFFSNVLDRFLSQREGGTNTGNKSPFATGEWELSLLDEHGARFTNQATIDRIVAEYTAAGWEIAVQFDKLLIKEAPAAPEVVS